ncbi:MAG: hypothetical protein CBD74_02495 [Saprospirales bacterium TMED214]|nr:MAG: hypothetical protein CBD74_02495 [Saprospirales bacterium TMED214]
MNGVFNATHEKSRRRLAIIGCGSSGLITLKYARDFLPDWEIHCFEASGEITGCWGDPYPGFVSTSTKFTTQFGCFPKYSAHTNSASTCEKNEFFQGDEYGQYLLGFADHFKLKQHIRLHTRVEQIGPVEDGDRWRLTLVDNLESTNQDSSEDFDHVIVCTGLAAAPKKIDSTIPQLTPADLHGPIPISEKRVVVLGGGESAVDLADRLSKPQHKNEVYLSLRSGIRVSPRYHPVRGVPSDFLRNRLMLSIHEDLRNWIGQRFVEARIRHQWVFERIFPSRVKRQSESDLDKLAIESRKQWDYRLTRHAKDDLFNMFHNKSDGFLDSVAMGRIKIIGAPKDNNFNSFEGFSGDAGVSFKPDFVIPSIGYRMQLQHLFRGMLAFSDFFLGCCHVTRANVHLVGFARPVIGNIPTISEMQARYVCKMIAGLISRPESIVADHANDLEAQQARYQAFQITNVYPVEMFPYCDRLAGLMGESLKGGRSILTWCRQQLEPATTLHYQPPEKLPAQVRQLPIYLPFLLIAVLIAIKPIDWCYRLWLRLVAKRSSGL